MENTGKKVLNVTVISIISKVLAMVGIVMYQSRFGLFDDRLNMFSYAQTLQTSIFTMLGTTLTTIIVPVYSSFLAKGEIERGKRYIDNILTLALAFVIVLVVVLHFLTPWIVSATSYEASFGTFAMRLLMPVMLFFAVRDILSGLVQSHGHFGAAAAASLPSSLVTILYVLFFSERFGVAGLVVSTLIGYALQALILLPDTRRTGYRYRFSFGLKDRDVLASLKLTPSVLLGVSAYQINLMYNNNLSTVFNATNVIAFMLNIILVPVLALTMSITAVYYPKMTAQWASGDTGGYKQSIRDILQVIAFIFLPMAVGLFLLRFDLMEILLSSGKITAEELRMSGEILGLFALSLVTVGIKEALDKVLYAQQKTLPSGLVGILMMAANILISSVLRHHIGVYALPCSYTISSFIGAAALFMAVRKKVGALGILPEILKFIISAVAMGGVVYVAGTIMGQALPGAALSAQLLRAGVSVLTGIAVYMGMAVLLKVNYASVLWQKAAYLIKRR